MGSIRQNGNASGMRYVSKPFAVLPLILEAMNSPTKNTSSTMNAIHKFIRGWLLSSARYSAGYFFEGSIVAAVADFRISSYRLKVFNKSTTTRTSEMRVVVWGFRLEGNESWKNEKGSWGRSIWSSGSAEIIISLLQRSSVIIAKKGR